MFRYRAKIQLRTSGSLTVVTEAFDNIVGDRMIVWRVGAVGTIRFERTVVHFSGPFHLMAALLVFRARAVLKHIAFECG